MDKKFYRWVDYLLLCLGGLLLVDSLMLHYIKFDYGTIGLAWIDPFFHHWMIGVALIGIALWDLRSLK